MDEVPASDNEHAVTPQFCKFPANLEMERRRPRLVDAELYDRHIGRGVDVLQHGPRTVIETPRIVERHGHRGEHLLQATREVGVPGRRILHFIELAWDSAKIVK